MPGDIQLWAESGYATPQWLYDPNSTPPWRNLKTGEYSSNYPFDPFNPGRQIEATPGVLSSISSLYPYYLPDASSFSSSTAPSAPSSFPDPESARFARAKESFQRAPSTPAAPAAPPVSGIPKPQYDDYWEDANGFPVPAGTPGAVHNDTAYLENISAWQQVTGNEPGRPGGISPSGPRGPTAAELAIERSRVQAQNLATFVSATAAELASEIDAGRLKTEQALGEFNKRMDAFKEAGQRFEGIQPYTIPIGAKYAPGFQPGGIGEQLGIAPRKAETIQYDPFAMANQIVAESPSLTDIGVPSGDALSQAIALAKKFAGG